MKIIPALLLSAAMAFAQGSGVIVSHYAKADFPLTADPNSKEWKGITGVFAENNQFGKPVPGHKTEIRSRWTNNNLYLLFICPYQKLYLHPNPSTTAETNNLWDWDVAEVFIGTDFKNIHVYKEFEVSPQGEWVDLDIDSRKLDPVAGRKWNSGFKSKTRVDEKNKVWYAEMQIPMKSIDPRPAKEGNEMRVNFYRIQGPPSDKKNIAWRPTNKGTYHVPESFGLLKLGK